MTVQDTCRKEKCPLYREHGRECPLLVENFWTNQDGVKSKTDDCAPVRSMLMQMDQHNRSLAVQKSNEELRNQVGSLKARFDTTLHETRKFMFQMMLPEGPKRVKSKKSPRPVLEK